MARDLDPAIKSAVVADQVAPILLAEIHTVNPDEPILCWSGFGPLIWQGKTFIGTGLFGKVEEVQESTDLKAGGIVLALVDVPSDVLDGQPSELIATVLAYMRSNRPVKLWFAVMDGSRLVVNPYPVFSGLTDVPEITDDASTVTIKIRAENRLIDLERPRLRRFTTEDQKLTDPTDKGFEYVEGLIDAQFRWGRV